MKKTLFGMAAAALLFAGCSKEELVEETIPSEGVSSVASSPGQEKNFWSTAPSIWFNENNGRMLVRLKGNTNPAVIQADIRVVFNNDDSTDEVSENGNPVFVAGDGPMRNVVSLQRIGNSRFYRSARNAADLPEEFDFSLASIDLSGGDEAIWNGDIFLYPSGRTVAQDPSVIRFRTRSVTNFDGANEMAVIIADDPTGQVAGVRFEATVEDSDGVVSGTVSRELELAQLNQSLGLSRWDDSYEDGKEPWVWTGSGEIYLLGSNSYDVPFVSAEANTQIIGKFKVEGEGTGLIPTTEVDEPEFLGTALRSKTGETWTYEVALADLGDWVETVTLTFPEQEGVFPTQNEFDMQLVRSEGNLKVFRTEGILFEGLEPGTDVQALVSGFGRGNRGATSESSTRTELL